MPVKLSHHYYKLDSCRFQFQRNRIQTVYGLLTIAPKFVVEKFPKNRAIHETSKTYIFNVNLYVHVTFPNDCCVVFASMSVAEALSIERVAFATATGERLGSLVRRGD